jgi:hypothetical protein
MAKKTFQIAPKLTEDKKPLPVQELSVAQIQQIVATTQNGVGRETENSEWKGRGANVVENSEERTPISFVQESAPVVKVAKAPKPAKKKPERPQGRPRREEKVIRVSSDLPEDLYKQMKTEINRNGYTMNGFLAKVLRGYFQNLKS